MKKPFGATLGVLGAAALALSGCAANEGDTAGSGSNTDAATSISGTFNGAGASAQEAAQAAWIAGYQSEHSGVTINYNPVGSGSGRTQFIEGGTVFAGSDAYLSDEELEGNFASCAADSKAIDLPVYISPIAVVFNIDGVNNLNLDPVTLAKVFRGDITRWNDPAIAGLNPDEQLPDEPITVVYRSDDSGTTENFTDYLSATAASAWDAGAVEAFPYSYAGAEGAQGTSGVISAVSNGNYTIGYADASKVGDLPTVALQVGDQFVKYTAEAAAAAVDDSPLIEGRGEHDLAIEINRTSDAEGVYPLVLVSYLIVCEEYADPTDAEFVKSYATYIASEAGQAAAQASAGSAPISPETRDLIQKAIDNIR